MVGNIQDNSLVSVITPAYNAEKFIASAIESVINQTYSHWEMIVTDDGSEDQTVDIIARYAEQDSRIRLIQMERNSGPARARNAAIRQSKGRYIAFLDSDDLWSPEKLQEQLKFMQQNNISFCFTDYKRISGTDSRYINTIRMPETITYKQYLKNTIIGTSTTILDKAITGPVEMPLIYSSQDMALWCRLLRGGLQGYGFNKVLTTYRVVENSHTANKFLAAQDVWRVYRKHEKLGVVSSLYYFIYYTFNAVMKRLKYRSEE